MGAAQVVAISLCALLLVALVAAGAIGGASVAGLQRVTSAHAVPAPMATRTAPVNPAVALPDFAQITAQNGPAVVNISVTGMAKTSNDGPVARRGGREDPFGNDPMFEFFHRFQLRHCHAQRAERLDAIHFQRFGIHIGIRKGFDVPTKSAVARKLTFFVDAQHYGCHFEQRILATIKATRFYVNYDRKEATKTSGNWDNFYIISHGRELNGTDGK